MYLQGEKINWKESYVKTVNLLRFSKEKFYKITSIESAKKQKFSKTVDAPQALPKTVFEKRLKQGKETSRKGY